MTDTDLVIVGSGFAGSLAACIARRCGWRVLLLEQSRHPRFVIGESTTPLTNLLLRQLAREHDLPWLVPLTRWGSWQEKAPHLPVGLKRGFAFEHHAPPNASGSGRAPAPPEDLFLVPASRHDAEADTHWYRPELDATLVHQARASGVIYRDRSRIVRMKAGNGQWTLTVETDGTADQRSIWTTRWLIDASHHNPAMDAALGIRTGPLRGFPGTRTLYTHFEGVRPWCRAHDPDSVRSWEDHLPFTPDDAALHHVFPGGWIWVLRFNNGITSAGAALLKQGPMGDLSQDPGIAWNELLDRLPRVAEQFTAARAVHPFQSRAPLAFQSGPVQGDRWILLPSRAGFVDPLLSSGFALTLLGLYRLAQGLFRHGPGAVAPEGRIPTRIGTRTSYAVMTRLERTRTADLTRALYRCMGDPCSFNAMVRLYFAAAHSFEQVLEQDPGGAPRELGFLLARHSPFWSRARRCCQRAGRIPVAELEADIAEAMAAIQPLPTHKDGCAD